MAKFNIEGTATKWVVLFVAFFIVATLAVTLLPLATDPFAANSNFNNLSCTNWYDSTCNATDGTGCADIPTNTTTYRICGSDLSTLSGAIPTVLIIVFVLALILLAIGAVKYSRHR